MSAQFRWECPSGAPALARPKYFNLQTCKSELNALQKIQSTLDEKRELYTFQLEELDMYELEKNIDHV